MNKLRVVDGSVVTPDNHGPDVVESDLAGVTLTGQDISPCGPDGGDTAKCSVVQADEPQPGVKQSENLDAVDLEITLDDAYASVDADCTKMSGLWDALFAMLYFWGFIGMLSVRFPVLSTYKQSRAISAALGLLDTDVPSCGSSVAFHDIETISDTFVWLTDALVPAVFVTEDYNGNPLEPKDWGRLDLANKVVGPVIFEVWRKTTSYKPHPADFFISFDTNASAAATILHEKKDDGDWLDTSTQRLAVTILTYNEQLDLYARTTLELDFTSNGYVDKSFAVASAEHESSTGTMRELIAFTVALLLVLRALTPFRFFRTTPGWSLVEQQTSLFAGVVKGRSWWEFSILFSAYEVGAAFWGVSIMMSMLSTPYSNLATLRLPEQTWNWGTIWVIYSKFSDGGFMTYFGALVVVLLGLQVIIIFRVERRLSILTRTIANAVRQAVAFFAVFSVIFMTFAASGALFFGSRVEEFSSFKRSMESCINMLFGEFGIESIQDLNGSFIFYWAYMLVVGLLMLNIILAIVVSAYEDVSAESYSSEASVEFTRLVLGLVWEVRMIMHNIRYWNERPKARRNRVQLLSVKNVDYIQRKLEAYKRQSEIVQELTHIEVVFGGRIRPRLLKEVLSGMRFVRDNHTTDDPNSSLPFGPSPDDVITPKTLQNMFPSASLTEEVTRATLKHIYEGIPTVIQAESNREEEASSRRSERRVSARGSAICINEASFLRSAEVPVSKARCNQTDLDNAQLGMASSSKTAELYELTARLAEVENKLGKLDSVELKLNLLLKSFNLDTPSD